MIYLASPYSDPSPAVRVQRFHDACFQAGEMLIAGLSVYSPIAHMHPIVELMRLPGDWETWEKFDREHIAHCTEVWVLCLEGWRDSKGVQAEIEIARELQKPIFLCRREEPLERVPAEKYWGNAYAVPGKVPTEIQRKLG